MKDEFGDRMKELERRFTGIAIQPDSYMALRLDGKGFSKLTKKMDKPFDSSFTAVMQQTMLSLMDETKAHAGYVQSDEITLMFKPVQEHWFGGKVSKINSVAASMATYFFHEAALASRHAFFDCRTWAVGDAGEASNVFLWRMQDCYRNAISSAHRWELNKKQTPPMDHTIMELNDAGIRIEDYPLANTEGTFAIRHRVLVQTENGTAMRHRINIQNGFSKLPFYERKAMFEVEARK